MAPRDSISFTDHANDWIHLLKSEQLAAINRHAKATYPQECCGMVLASGKVRPCSNAQDKLHQLDPIGYPQTSANAYCFDANDQLFLAQSFENGDPVRIIYHSHPDSPPEFSETDRRGATIKNQETYPGLAFLIVSSSEAKTGPAKLFIYSNGDYFETASWNLVEQP